MLEIEMSKDIRDFQPRILGPFTKRQIVCVVLGISVVAILLPIVKIEDIALRVLVLALFAVPFILCGWVTLFGMPLEQFALQVLKSTILAVPVRKYKTENKFDYLKPKFEKQKCIRSKAYKAMK